MHGFSLIIPVVGCCAAAASGRCRAALLPCAISSGLYTAAQNMVQALGAGLKGEEKTFFATQFDPDSEPKLIIVLFYLLFRKKILLKTRLINQTMKCTRLDR
ncbi:hypothetical protein [Desulfovibrio desulfuricans]|uniref:hypothetical protein n=1 Tax=Desulfovibrio desulfuricans TaxID=876 RepID=UPI0035B4975C